MGKLKTSEQIVKRTKRLATTFLISTGILTAGLAHNIVAYDNLDNKYQNIVKKYSYENPAYIELLSHATNTAIRELQDGEINDKEFIDKLDELREKPNEDILKQTTTHEQFKEYEKAKKEVEIIKYATIGNTLATGLVSGFAIIKTIDAAENAKIDREEREFN